MKNLNIVAVTAYFYFNNTPDINLKVTFLN